jgi:hypothetical protein
MNRVAKVTPTAWTPCNQSSKSSDKMPSKTGEIWQIERIARSDAKGFKLELAQGAKERHFSGC